MQTGPEYARLWGQIDPIYGGTTATFEEQIAAYERIKTAAAAVERAEDQLAAAMRDAADGLLPYRRIAEAAGLSTRTVKRRVAADRNASAAAEDLYRAIEADDVDRIEHLLTTRPDLADSAEDATPPPIHWAIYRDKREVVEALLNHGADLALRDRDRDATPLDYAVIYARKELIPVLISHGASLDGGMRVALKGASGGLEEYAELPSRRQYEGIVGLLRELGAEPQFIGDQ